MEIQNEKEIKPKKEDNERDTGREGRARRTSKGRGGSARNR